MSWSAVCSYSVSQMFSFSSWNNLFNKNKRGEGRVSEERSLTLKYFHRLLVSFISFYSSKSHSLSSIALFLSMFSPYSHLIHSAILKVLMLFLLTVLPLPSIFSSPILSLSIFLFLLADLLPLFPHRRWPDVDVCRHQLLPWQYMSAWRETGRWEGDRELRGHRQLLAKGSLCSFLPVLEHSIPSIAQVGRKSVSVHPTGCFSPISLLLSSQPAGAGSRYSCS